MKSKSVSSDIPAIAAGICAAALIGTAVSCTVKSMNKSKAPSLKKSAVKALRSVEHYIDNMM